MASLQQVEAFRMRAQYCASDHLTQLLEPIARAPELAVLLDFDALDLARGDLATVRALDALALVRVQVVIVARGDVPTGIRRGVPSSWRLRVHEAIGCVRAIMPAAPTLAITDDRDLLALLGPDDRALALRAPPEPLEPNIAAADVVTVHAALYWLIDVRVQAGLVAES